MQTWTLRLGMSLMVVVGFWTNRLPAQGDLLPKPAPLLPARPMPLAPAVIVEPYILVVPPIHYAPLHSPLAESALESSRVPSGIAQHPLRRALNCQGLGCKDDPYYTTCGSLRYELRFIFGSCRSFFDQSCEPNQPCAHRRSGVFDGFYP